jgi:GNAT superfamily N-acetyltransferase
MLVSGFWHGVERETLSKSVGDAVGFWTRSPDWQVDIATSSDPDLSDEIAGFSIHSGPGVVAFSYVRPAFRGLGIWRALRDHAGLREGQNIEIILGNPNALRLARRRYRVFHVPFRILEALPKGTP